MGALQTVSLPNGLKHFYNYNARQQLASCGIANASNQTALGYAYALNATGRRTQTTEFHGATATRTVSYAYDALHRLVGESITALGVPPSGGPSGAISYTLDAVGNRLSRTSTVPGVPNSNHTYTANDRLSGDTYDPNGNTMAAVMGSTGVSPVTGGILASASVSDIYDFENRLLRRTQADGKIIDIAYDADGHRVAKSIHGSSPTKTTHYLVDTNNPTGYAQVIEERTSAASLLSTINTQLSIVYAYGHDLISQDRKSTGGAWNLSYYLYDGGGHVRTLANTSATLTDSYTYDAYGILIERTGTTENTYLYRGEQWDEDLGLYYQRARYLNPATGRFWTQDSYEGANGEPSSLHKYLYANGDPVGGWDPSGNYLISTLRYGREVHEKIGDDFEANGYGRSDRSIAAILNGIPAAAGILVRPDLVTPPTKSHNTGYIYEIKPFLSANAGAAQLASYLLILIWLDKKNYWITGYQYRPPTIITLYDGKKALIMGPAAGLITYMVLDPTPEMLVAGAVTAGAALTTLKLNLLIAEIPLKLALARRGYAF